MAEFIKYDVKGLDQVKMHLEQLPQKVATKHLRRILKEGAEVIATEARRLIPHRKINSGWEAFVTRPGTTLRDAVAVKVTISPSKGTANALIGLDYAKVHHGHLVEFGTRAHNIPIKTARGKIRIVRHPGGKKQPFMRPAFDNKGEAVTMLICEKLMAAVYLEV